MALNAKTLSFDHLLMDPLIRSVMRADRVDSAELETMLRTVASALTASRERSGLAEASPEACPQDSREGRFPDLFSHRLTRSDCLLGPGWRTTTARRFVAPHACGSRA